MALDNLELDWKSQAILAALAETDQETTTSELSGLTGIEDNRKILYRIREKLGPEGFVEVVDTDQQVGGGQIPPTRARLTDEGKQLAQELDEERGRVTDVTERIEGVEADLSKVEHVQEELSELQARIKRLEGTDDMEQSGEGMQGEVEELNRRVSFLWDAVLAIRKYLETEHDVDLKEYIEEVDADDQTIEPA